MPALTLQVVSIDAAPVGQPTMHAFDVNGGSIGRDETNFLPLPDKHRRVSRLHATISFPGGMPTITNSSTSLPLSVGEQQLDGGESMLITHGALIEIGPYILQAHIGSDVQAAGIPQSPAPVRRDTLPTVMPAAMPAGRPVQSPSAAAFPASDPLAAWPAAPNNSSMSSLIPAPAAPAVSAWSGQIGDDFADLGLPSKQLAVPTAPAAAATSIAADVDPFADLLAGIGATPPPQTHANLPASPVPYRASGHSGMSDDPLASFGGASSGSTDLLMGQPSRNSTSLRFSGGQMPEDFNPFHMPTSADRNSADPLAAIAGGSGQGSGHVTGMSVAPPSIDSLFQSGNSQPTNGGLLGFESETRGNDGTIDSLIRFDGASDPLSLFDPTALSQSPAAPPMRDDALEVGSAFSPPLANAANSPGASALPLPADMMAALPANTLASPEFVPASAGWLASAPPASLAQPVTPPVVAAAMSATEPAAAVSPDALTAAFLRGAGLSPSALPHGLTPEIMTIVGSLLRSATAGAVDMLAARAATKREVQASVTIISVQANNPLKFLPNADAALLQLLGKKMPGFMRADVAMRDAFDDLRAHEVGVIAGTRAALTEVLGKFDPAVLGDKLAKGSVLESLMPSARKAKLWDMYLERYLQIRREAEDDFQSIFGRAFVQAYERETARIKGESPMAGGE